MANPTDRQSLTLNMEDRYKKSNAGGAFDAKSAGEKLTDGIPNDFADGFTKGGVNTGLPKKDSIFLKGHDKQIPKSIGKVSLFTPIYRKLIEKVSDSIFLKGHNSKKYKG